MPKKRTHRQPASHGTRDASALLYRIGLRAVHYSIRLPLDERNATPFVLNPAVKCDFLTPSSAYNVLFGISVRVANGGGHGRTPFDFDRTVLKQFGMLAIISPSVHLFTSKANGTGYCPGVDNGKAADLLGTEGSTIPL
ncbi:hypothetical protein CBL_08227 [Carabus blaptoides fortunei]